MHKFWNHWKYPGVLSVIREMHCTIHICINLGNHKNPMTSKAHQQKKNYESHKRWCTKYCLYVRFARRKLLLALHSRRQPCDRKIVIPLDEVPLSKWEQWELPHSLLPGCCPWQPTALLQEVALNAEAEFYCVLCCGASSVTNISLSLKKPHMKSCLKFAHSHLKNLSIILCARMFSA